MAGAWRWSLLIIFPLGWAVTCGHFGNSSLEYALLNALSFVACVWFLAPLKGSIRTNLAAWTIFGVLLIIYYIKFYLIVIDPDLLMTVGSLGGLVRTFPPSEDTLLSADIIMVSGFVAFSMACNVLRLMPVGRRSSAALPGPTGLGLGKLLMVLTLFAAALITMRAIVAYRFGIIINGNGEAWPFHLMAIYEFVGGGTILLLPLVIIDFGQRRCWQVAGFTLLFAGAAVDMLLLTTKGSLAHVAVALAALWLVKTGSITRKQMSVLVACVALMAALYPLMILFRSARLGNSSMGLPAALEMREYAGSAVNGATAGKSIAETILGRLPGADALVAMVDHDVRPLDLEVLDLWIKERDDIIDYITDDIFQVAQPSPDVRVTLMPSLLGEFYVIGGGLGVAAGMALFTIWALSTWNWLMRQRFRTLRAMQAVFILFVFGATVEGGVDYRMSRAFPLSVVAALLVEGLVRTWPAKIGQRAPLEQGWLPDTTIP
jgi:hypothetical protein